jgi:CBS domain containing-hemolysin-like protein
VSAANVLELLVAALLVPVAAVLSGCETALAHVSRLRVEELVRDGRRGAARLATVVSDATAHLNVLLLVRTVAEMVAATLLTVVCVSEFPSVWEAVLVAGIGMALVQYVVVGVGARTLGRQHADMFALHGAGLALVLKRVLGPVPRVLIGLGSALIPGQVPRDGGFTSEAELRDLVDQAEKFQVIERGEREMIHSVFELGDTLVREVMVPRTDMVWIERQKTVRQALSLALRSGFSRIPVVGVNEDDVVGIAYLKDLARRVQDDDTAAAGPDAPAVPCPGVQAGR